MRRKNINIGRIVRNAATLSVPVISDCFFYGDCGDVDGFYDVVYEIDNLQDRLPEGIDLLDLPDTIVGNSKTKVYGYATCASTEGHQILRMEAPHRIFFDDEDEAESRGYRPCGKCMPEAYKEWKQKHHVI